MKQNIPSSFSSRRRDLLVGDDDDDDDVSRRQRRHGSCCCHRHRRRQRALVWMVSLLCGACSAFAAPWGGRPFAANNKNKNSFLSSSSSSSSPTSSSSSSSSDHEHAEQGESQSAAAEASTKSPPKKERGKLLEDPVGAENLYQAYQEIQKDYQERAFGRKDWKILNEQDGVQVAMLQHPSDPTCPYVRMKAVIPVSVQECWNFLLVSEWDRSMPKMDPFYEGVSIYGEYKMHKKGIYMVLCRKRTKRILAFGKRDLVFVSVQDTPLSDGTWVSGSVSVRAKSLPRMPGYTRAFQDSIAFYKPLEHNTKTGLTIVCRIDLNDSSEDGSGGFMPMWLYVKTIGLTGVQSVIRMRNALIAEKKEQDANKSQQQAAAVADAAQQENSDTTTTTGKWWRRRKNGNNLPPGTEDEDPE